MEKLDGLRVYISPCGVGSGHIARCHPIAEELVNQGAKILFSTYLDGLDYAKRFGLPVVESPAMSLTVDAAGHINMKMTSTQAPIVIPQFLRQVNAEIENLRAFEPDIVVSDSRVSSIVAAKLLEIPTIVILNQYLPVMPRMKRFFNLSKIADGTILALMSEGWGLSDRILIPDFPPPYTLSLGNLRIPKRQMPSVSFIGTIMTKQLARDTNLRSPRKSLGLENERALLFAPISGPKEERQPLIDRLTTIFKDFPDEYTIIMSLGDANADPAQTQDKNLTIIPWIENRFDYLSACDLVISRAGHGTIMQSIFFEKPQLIIPTPGHTEQYFNARRAQEFGVARVIHQEETGFKRLLAEVRHALKEADLYSANCKKIREEQRFDGVSNAINEIVKLLEKN